MTKTMKYDHKLLMKHLYKHRQEYTTMFKLANVVGYSQPTTTTLINELKEIIKVYGADIIVKQGYGYKLVIVDTLVFQELLDANFFMDDIKLSEKEEWMHYMIREFLVHNILTSSHFEEKLFLTKRPIFHLYKDMATQLNHYDLKLENASSQGNKLMGTEHNIRSCILNELVYGLNSTLEIEEEFLNLYRNLSLWKEIKKVIIQHQMSYNSNRLDDTSISYLTMALHIAHVRNMSHHTLNYDEDTKDRFVKRNSYYISNSIIKSLVNSLNLELGENEIIFCAIFIIANRSFESKEQFPNSEGYLDCMHLSLELVQYLQEENQFCYIDKDSDLIETLSLNLTQILTQSEFNLYKVLDVYRSSKSLQASLLATQSAKYLQKRIGIKIVPSQIDYLATLIYPYFGRFPFAKAKGNALVISNINISVGQGIAQRIKRNFGNYIENVDLINLYELPYKKLDEYKILFTSYPIFSLPPLPKDMKVIEIDTFFHIQEKPEIRKQILDLIEISGVRFDYLDMFKNAKIYRNITGITKQEIYNHLSKMNENKELSKELMEYEALMDFTVKHNVVFITPLRTTAEDTIIQVLVLNKNVYWSGSKIRVVVYWDRGLNNDRFSYFENESIPQLVYQVFTQNEVIESLLKDSSQTEDWLSKLSDKMIKEIIETGSSFR